MPQDKSFDYIIKVPSDASQAQPLEAAAPKLQRIKVIDKTDLKGQKRRDVIKRIFEQKKAALQADSNIIITEWDSDDQKARYRIGSSDSQIFEIKTDTAAPNVEVHLAIKEEERETTGDVVLARLEAFGSSYKKLFLEHKEGNVGLFLWWLIVLPTWAVLDSMGALEKEARKPFLEEVTPSTPDAFLETLSTTRTILAAELEGKDIGILERLESGIARGKKLILSVNSADDRETFKLGIAKAINGSGEKDPVLLPAGYYTEKGYHPALLSFYKKDDDTWVVQKFSMACEDPLHTGKMVPMLEYELKTADAPAFFDHLIALQTPPKKIVLSAEEQKQRAALGAKPEQARPVERISDPFSALLGNPLPIDENAERIKPSDDPWKLIFAWAKTSDPALVPDKKEFMTIVTEHAASHIFKYLDRLPEDQKGVYLKLLDARLAKLGVSLQKKDPELSKAILGHLKDLVHREALKPAAQNLLQRDAARFAALTNPIPSSPLTISMRKSLEVGQAADVEVQQEKGLPGIYIHSAEIDALDKIFRQAPVAGPIKAPSAEEAAEAVAALKTLHGTVETLLDAKDYRKARIAAALALSCLPSMDTPDVWKNFSVEQLDELGRMVEALSGDLFEAKVRLGDSHLWPDELIHVWNAKAVLVSFARERYSRLKEEARLAYNKKPTGTVDETIFSDKKRWDEFFDKEEITVLAPLLKELNIPLETAEALCFRDFTLESSQICNLIEKNPYLHFGEDPVLNRKAIALVKFFEEDRVLNRKAIALVKFSEEDRESRDAVLLNAFENKDLHKTTEKLFLEALAPIRKEYIKGEPTPAEFVKHAKEEIERTDDTSKQQRIPPFLIDIRRHEAWTDALSNPKGSLFLCFSGKKGMLSALSWVTQTADKAKAAAKDESEIPAKVREIQYIDIRKRLGDMGRLRLNIGKTVFDDENPVVQILTTSDFRHQSSDSAYGLCIFPRQLQGKLSHIPVVEDPNFFQPVLGVMPESVTTLESGYSEDDKFILMKKEKKPSGPISEEKRPTLLNTRNPYVLQTPAEFFLSAVENESYSELDPIDRTRLMSLKSSEKPYFTSFNCWQLIEFSPHLLDLPSIQNRLIQLLFSAQSLQMHLFLSPSQLSRVAKNLDNQIAECLHKGQIERAGFLMYLSEHLAQNTKEAVIFWQKIKAKDNEALDQLFAWESKVGICPPFSDESEGRSDYNKDAARRADDMIRIYREDLIPFIPTSDKEFRFTTPEKKELVLSTWKELLSAFDPPNIAKDLKSLSLFLLAGLDEKKISEMTPQEAAVVLRAWKILRSAETDISIPNLREQILMKMERSLLSALAKKMNADQNYRAALLNKWAGANYPQWESIEGNPCRFIVTEDGKEVASADIATCEISGKSSAAAAMHFPIPSEIAQNSIYVDLFGNERFSAVITGSKDNPWLQECRFTSNGRDFTLHYDRKKKELTVFQTINKATYKYASVTCSEKTNFAKAIQHYGLWAHVQDPSNALLLPGKMQEWATTADLMRDAFTLKMDAKGQVLSIRNSEGLRVVQDSNHTATPFFPFVEEGDLVFLRDPSGETIKRVRLLKEKMEFEILGNGTLRPLDKELGWKVWSYKTAPLVQMFGPSFEQFMIPLARGKELELRLFPHAIYPTRVKAETEMLLDFEKKAPWETSLPSLTIKIDEQEKMHGSHAAFLYLAYVAFSQGQIDRAAIYLEEASRADKTDPKEVGVIQLISSLLREQPHATARTTAFQLKAEMTLRRILRDFYHVPEFKPESWEAHSKEIERTLTLHREYQAAEQDKDKNAQLKGAKLLLTPSEEEEFDLFRAESISSLLEIEEGRPLAPAAEGLQLKRPRSAFDSSQFMPHLILRMQPPTAGATEDTLATLGTTASADNVLQHFWTYWTLISQGKLKTSALSTLMLPIPAAKGSDPALLESVDYARRLLFTFAQYVEQFPSIITSKEIERQSLIDRKAGLESQLHNANLDITSTTQDEVDALAKKIKPLSEEIAQRRTSLSKLPQLVDLEAEIADLKKVEALTREEITKLEQQILGKSTLILPDAHETRTGAVKLPPLTQPSEAIETRIISLTREAMLINVKIRKKQEALEKVADLRKQLEEKEKEHLGAVAEHKEKKAPLNKISRLESELQKIEALLKNKEAELKVLKGYGKNLATLFPTPAPGIFELRKSLSQEEIKLLETTGLGINTIINYFRGQKLQAHQTALQSIIGDLSLGFNFLLQGMEGKEGGAADLSLPGADKLVPEELQVALPVKKSQPVKLSTKAFQEKIAQSGLSEEERALYSAALDKIGVSEEMHPVSELLRKLLTEGQMPMVALRRYNALKKTVVEKEKPLPSPTPFVESTITLEAVSLSKFPAFFTSDLKLPTDAQLDRLAHVFNENRQYAREWLGMYQQIATADGSKVAFLIEQMDKAPVTLARSKDVAQQLLSAAAQRKFAKIGLADSGLRSRDSFVVQDSMDPAILKAFRTECEKFGKEAQQAFIDERCTDAKKPFLAVPPNTPASDIAMVKHENQRFIVGLTDAAEKKKVLIDSKKGFINDGNVGGLIDALQGDIKAIQSSLPARRRAIFEAFAPLAGEFGLEAMFRNPEKYSAMERMNAILDLCEDGKLSNEINDPVKRDALLSLVAQYLFAATEMQQKEKALDDAAKLAPLAKKREELQTRLVDVNKQISSLGTGAKADQKRSSLTRESTQIQKQIAEIEIEWKELSSSIEDKIDSGENDRRFSQGTYKTTILTVLKSKIEQFTAEKASIDQLLLNDTTAAVKLPEAKRVQLEGKSRELEALVLELTARRDKVTLQMGDLVDQEQTLAYLVREFRQKIIFTTAQVEKIESILDDPNALEEFRMGLGKSSVIFPAVARILINRGKFPIVLFTEELIEQSRKDMDKKAYFFQFSRSSSVTPESLAEEYNTLLSVKRSKRYVITTVERIAALENKIIEIQKSLATAWSGYKDKTGAAKEAAYTEMSQSLEQIFWLQKIASLFDAPDTRIVADEIDEIFAISSEKNYSDGELSNINKLAFDTGERIFHAIFKISPDENRDDPIPKFRNALLTDKLSNFNKPDVQAAMKALAETIYEDEAFWISNGWKLEERPDKAEFAEYVSNSAITQLPQGMPVWSKDLKDEAALQKVASIGALRHWMTKTMPTLAEKQDGKDYGFGPDGYSVVPRREQREKPNTKFGQEAELIGYHLLAYARNGRNDQLDAFFISQIAEIQTRSTKEPAPNRGESPADHNKHPWRNWLLALDPSQSGEPKVILESYHKDENQAERIAFLRFIMQESPRIQVYTSQLTRNVQDTILGRKVAGASGTMSRYSLPNQFSYDRSKDARTGTGDTLMRLALMGEGFDEKVGTFTNLMDQMTDLTGDSHCKAIINQGYATPNMTSKDVIAQFRQREIDAHVPLAQRRQYIFVDPEFKKAYVWLPGDLTPQPFDKDLDAKKVSPDRVLYYFGPADTRGTDFKIPYGYGALIVGPTTTPDEFDQAIWRLRALGQGQDSKVFVDETHAKRFAEDISAVQFKDLIADVELKGVQSSAVQNLKAATSRPEAALRQEVKKALFTPMGDSSRFLKAKTQPGARLNLEKEMEGCAQSFDAVGSLFVRSKALNFQSDYTPSVMVDIMGYLDTKYDEVEKKIGSEQTSGILRDLPKASRENDLGTQRVEMLRAQVQLAKSTIADERALVQTESESAFHKQFLPGKVSSSETAEKDVQAEVQEQQQQQQQQQTELLKKPKKQGMFGEGALASRGTASNYQFPFFNGFLLSAPQPMTNIYTMDSLYPNCGLGIKISLNMTQSMREWMKVCPPAGKSVGFLVMYKLPEGQASEWVATWMTNLDYEKFVPKMMMTPEIAEDCLSILAISENAVEPEIVFNLKPLPGKYYDELLVAIAKLTMGFTAYPEGERKKLYDWFTKELTEGQRDNWIAVLSQKQANKQCIEMLIEWNQGKPYTPIVQQAEPGITPVAKPLAPLKMPAASVQKPEKKEPALPLTSAARKEITLSSKAPRLDHRDVGGLGRCADYSLLDQLKQMGRNDIAQQTLRTTAASYLIDNINAIKVDPVWMNQIKTALRDAPDRPSKITPENIDTLDPAVLVKSYAEYISRPNTWLDGPAFKALVANRARLEAGMQIAIVEDAEGEDFKITSQYPDSEALNPEKCLFIWYNQKARGLGNHYQSFNRDSLKLKEAVQVHQKSFLKNFIETLASTDHQLTVQKTILELSIHDPISYHALCHLIWDHDKPVEQNYLAYAQQQLAQAHDLRVFMATKAIAKDTIESERVHFHMVDGRIQRKSQ